MVFYWNECKGGGLFFLGTGLISLPFGWREQVIALYFFLLFLFFGQELGACFVITFGWLVGTVGVLLAWDTTAVSWCLRNLCFDSWKLNYDEGERNREFE